MINTHPESSEGTYPVFNFPLEFEKPAPSQHLCSVFDLLIRNTERELKICSPFLDEGGVSLLEQAFETAARRGVKCQLLVKLSHPVYPPKKQVLTYRWLYTLFGNNLAIGNVALYCGTTKIPGFDPANAGSAHSKLLISDDKVAYVGSGEITFSSLVYNFEAGIVSTEAHIVRPLEQAFDSVARQASLIDPHWVWKRIRQLAEAGSSVPPSVGQNPKKNNGLRGQDDVRTYAPTKSQLLISKIPSYTEGRALGWHIPVRDLLLHIVGCEGECSDLHMILNGLVNIVPDYQRKAA